MYRTDAIKRHLNIPWAKNIWGSKRISAGVNATPIKQNPPKTPKSVAA